jgi:hypothetical protein
MPEMLRGRGAIEREIRQNSAPRQRSIALVELITTAALALSTAVAATAVSIGIARADVIGAAAKAHGLPFAIALSIGLLLAAVSGVAAIAAASPRRH